MAISNPIIPGFNPDPSCVYVEGTFYLVTSTFLYFPGIPVYTSTDLKNWKQIGNVVNRTAQLDYTNCRLRPGTQLSGGLWAPTIRFSNGTFYVTTTLVFPDKAFDDFSRWQNVIFTSKDPLSNEWSDPIPFDYPGYDTSLFWDDDGRIYVQGSFYYRIRDEISQYEIDVTTGRSLSGEPKKIWSGTGGKAPEAPHMYKKDGWYYLLIAEGGTEFGHCATMARSRTVWGPFEPCPQNPVLRAVSPDSLFQTIGHADVFSKGRDQSQFWAVCLATRVVNDSYPMGRETCLMEVDWSGDWPIISTASLEGTAASRLLTRTDLAAKEAEWTDLIAPSRHHLLYLRNPSLENYVFHPNPSSAKQHCLTLTPGASLLSDPLGSPTFIGYRQQHLRFKSEVIFDITTLLDGCETGLAIFLDHEHYIAVHIVSSGNSFRISLRKIYKGIEQTDNSTVVALPAGVQSVRLSVLGEIDEYTFQAAFSPAARSVAEIVTLGTGATKEVSGGFTGTLVAIFAVQGTAVPPGNSGVTIHDWRYKEMA